MLKETFIPGAIGLLLCVVLAACASTDQAPAGGASQPADSKRAPDRPTTTSY